MLTPGYYTVHRDAILTFGAKRIRLRKHDWLVTDGAHIGIFDKGLAMDWVPMQGAAGQPLILTGDSTSQIDSVAVPIRFAQMERRLQQELDTGDGAPLPDMPKAPIGALGPYLRSNRTGYTYAR